ncbi:calcium/sodium antiporter [Lascolabacillus massiliensis]|uniref:calcium/sodium antiporter n=1 Tax=Lascolabacillus massiliensis TaxID=1627894 RepID=UPI0006B3B5D2|nr:calcium/sodium antiporter [Lascolabacillus massiliensis]
MEIVWLLLSLVILYFGAEGLVSGASSLAKRLAVSPLVIGLTIVSIGTSMPELVVSSKAALAGQSALSIGNVLGSNMFNVGIILGLSAIIYPVLVKRQLLKLDVPIMIFSSILFLIFFLDSRISRIESGLMLLIFISYIIYLYLSSNKDSKKTAEDKSQNIEDIKMSKHWVLDLIFILVGLLGLVYGSDLLVVNSVIIAERLGMSEALIGMTIVATGTSMPELATSVVAAIKKRSDIAIGNVVGSNIFNIFLILGVAGLIHPISTTEINYFDSMFVVLLGLVLWLFMKLSTRITRWQGVAFLFLYALYFTIKTII